MSSRKRSGSGSKRPKEKVVYIYEMLLRTDFEDPVKNNAEFWNEFFLLQPNVEVLEGELTKLSFEHLVGLKRNINLLFTQSIELLDSGRCTALLHATHIFTHLLSPQQALHVIHHLNGNERAIIIFSLQIIRNVCVIRYKHCAHYFIRYLNGMRRMRPAWTSFGLFSTLMRPRRR